jgi:hypothetical protein
VARFDCPYLGREVELTSERERHIRLSHPVDAERILQGLPAVLHNPDYVFVREGAEDEYLLAKEVDLPSGTKHIVVIVVRQADPPRLWVITAFVARRLSGGNRWKAI